MCLAHGQVVMITCKATGYTEVGAYWGKTSDCYLIKTEWGDKLYKMDDWFIPLNQK